MPAGWQVFPVHWYHYESLRLDNEALRQRLCELAAVKRRYGDHRLHVLMQRKGWLVNRKKLFRVVSTGWPKRQTPQEETQRGRGSATKDSGDDA